MTRTITYRGPTRGVGLLARILSEEGLEGRYATPVVERRRSGDIVDVVAIDVSMKVVDEAADDALDTALKTALAKFRWQVGRAAQVDEY